VASQTKECTDKENINRNAVRRWIYF